MPFKFGKNKFKKNKKEKHKKEKNSNKDQKQENKKSNNGPQRVSEKEHLFSDVKLYRIMPWILAVALLLIFGGFSWMGYNTHVYNVAQAKVSMKEGKTLPLYYGTQANQQKGTLTVGRSIISRDHKQMAVSIRYDSTAHTSLSAFGDEYRLYFVCTPNYPAQDIHIKYGFFGTDGNGVLQIKSDKPFKNEAFDIILVDKQDLASAEELTDNSNNNTMSDDQLTKSITAELSTGTMNNNASGTNESSVSGDVSNGKIKPASYFVRLNPYSAKQVDLNWGNNELKLVDNLFVKHNLKKIQASINVEKAKIKQAKMTLAEYNHRLDVNPNDAYAQQQKQQIQSALSSLESDVQQNQKHFDTIKKARLKNDILGSEADTYTTLRTANLNNVQTQDQGQGGNLNE